MAHIIMREDIGYDPIRVDNNGTTQSESEYMKSNKHNSKKTGKNDGNKASKEEKEET